MSSTINIPRPVNEPVLSYAPGSAERASLKAALKKMSDETIDIPIVIGGKEVRTGRTIDCVSPHAHKRVLAKVHQASAAEVKSAICEAQKAWREWSSWSFEDRAAVFLKAADLLAGPWRPIVNAATMLGQSKTA